MAGLSQDDLNKLKAELKAQADLQQRLTENTADYYKLIKDIKNLHVAISASKKVQLEQEAKAKKAAEAYKKEVDKGVHANTDLVKELEVAVELEKTKLGLIKEEVIHLEKATAELTKQAKEARNVGHFFAGMTKDILAVSKGVKQSYGKLKEWTDSFKNDKAIRMAATQMGLLTKQTDSFRNSLDYAGQQTASFGVGIGELAKMQGDYSDELGRSVMLGQQGLEAMAQMSKATGLGAEGAAKMAADFEQQGISAERTRDLVEQTMNDSTKMGINASKVIKNIQANMKMLNKYNFKGGVKGLTKMAQTVTKLGVNMDFVAGMADKLFDVEGAVDMSAQLQVMGGAWAKLADPFKLMYMARNDMEGLVEEMGKAAEASVHFNKKSGDFEISAMEMHKLRKIAEQTGVAYEDLATAGKNAAKMTQIKKQMSFSVPKDVQEFLSTTAKFNDKGEAYINIDGNPKLLKSLSSADKSLLQSQIAEKASLKDRAEASQTFDEKLKNIVMQMKQFLLPFMTALDKGFRPVVQKFTDAMKNPKIIDGLKSAAETAGKVLSVIGKFIANNPVTTLVGAIAGMGLLQAAKWYLNGKALGMGFNSVASVGGGGGIMNMLGGKRGGMGGGMMKGLGGLLGGKNTMLGRGTRNLSAGMMKGGMGFKPSLGLGLAGGALGMGADMIRGGMDDPESTGGKLLGIGGTAASWAGMGAMAGPWGALIGGILGAGKGTYDEYFSDDAKKKASLLPGMHDGIFSATKSPRGIIQGGGITPIDNKDDLIAKKPNGAIDKALGTNTSSTMKIEFGEIHFKFDELKITSPGNPGVAIDLLKDPQFIRNITRMIHVETEKTISQGKVKG